jgi:hypothetical protein
MFVSRTFSSDILSKTELTQDGKEEASLEEDLFRSDEMGKEWSKDELAILEACHEHFGDHWTKYEEYLPGRTYAAMKNRWLRLEKDKNNTWKGLFDNTTFGPGEDEIIDNILSWKF